MKTTDLRIMMAPLSGTLLAALVSAADLDSARIDELTSLKGRLDEKKGFTKSRSRAPTCG